MTSLFAGLDFSKTQPGHRHPRCPPRLRPLVRHGPRFPSDLTPRRPCPLPSRSDDDDDDPTSSPGSCCGHRVARWASCPVASGAVWCCVQASPTKVPATRAPWAATGPHLCSRLSALHPRSSVSLLRHCSGWTRLRGGVGGRFPEDGGHRAPTASWAYRAMAGKGWLHRLWETSSGNDEASAPGIGVQLGNQAGLPGGGGFLHWNPDVRRGAPGIIEALRLRREDAQAQPGLGVASESQPRGPREKGHSHDSRCLNTLPPPTAASSPGGPHGHPHGMVLPPPTPPGAQSHTADTRDRARPPHGHLPCLSTGHPSGTRMDLGGKPGPCHPQCVWGSAARGLASPSREALAIGDATGRGHLIGHRVP